MHVKGFGLQAIDMVYINFKGFKYNYFLNFDEMLLIIEIKSISAEAGCANIF